MTKAEIPRRRMSSAEGRIWLSATKAKIQALAKELETSDEEDSFTLIYELRGDLWYKQESYALTREV